MKFVSALGSCALAIVASLACSLPSSAADSGGIAGYLLDASGRPLAGVQFEIASAQEARMLRTDRNGFFSDITLDPGTYAFSTGDVYNASTLCPVVHVLDGEVAHVRIAGTVNDGHLTCQAFAGSTGVVDPNQTADVYRIGP